MVVLGKIMNTDFQKITIIKLKKPSRNNINEQLQWFGVSLGLFNLRDKDKSCFRIFVELIKDAKQSKSISSDEMANSLKLSRGTVMHHMNKLMEAGIVTCNKNRYCLRVNNLELLIDELDKDADRILSDMKDMANEIDKLIGL
jgi:predicted transcriptional regulator